MMNMNASIILLSVSIFSVVQAFTVHPGVQYSSCQSPNNIPTTTRAGVSTTTTIFADVTAAATEDAETSTSDVEPIDPKEAVKLFGRLAEKYIMLDSSGGMCCYSACSDCEFRLPDGGYRMADQSAARPKWIPSYDDRSFESSGKQHTSKWSTDIFTSGPAVNKEEFVERLVNSDFAPPLGGPYMSARAAGIENTSAAERLFDILLNDDEKEKLTKHRMGKRVKELAGGEEGMIWSDFLASLS